MNGIEENNEALAMTNNGLCLPYFPFFQNLSSARSGSRRRPNNDREDHGSPLLAVNCGSASRGLTKYLSERTDLGAIYAIDPSKMDVQVLSLPNVHHLRMIPANAILCLREVLSSTRGGSRGGRGGGADGACMSRRDRSMPSCAFASQGCSNGMPHFS